MDSNPMATVSLTEGARAMECRAKELHGLTIEYAKACASYDKVMGYSLGGIRRVTVNIIGKKAGDARQTEMNAYPAQRYIEDIMKPLQQQVKAEVDRLYEAIQKIKEEI